MSTHRPFTATFDGNNDTDASGDGGPYKISNLFIRQDGSQLDGNQNYRIGLFGEIGSTGKVHNLTLEDVDIDHNPSWANSSTDIRVGAIAGTSAGTIEDSYVIGGTVKFGNAGGDGSSPNTVTTGRVGGIVGYLESGGNVVSSYSNVAVESSGPITNIHGGGIAGEVAGTVSASYAAGEVDLATTVTSSSTANAGGLAGILNNGDVNATYASGAVEATGAATNRAGGLIGYANGTIYYSYSLGTTTATTDGGLTAAVDTSKRNDTYSSYYDSEKSGDSSSATGTAKTTSELQTPTAYGTRSSDIYKDWNIDLDNADNDNDVTTGTDDPWSFGTSTAYPTLKYGSLSSVEQSGSLTISASPTTIYERAVGSRVNSTTLSFTLRAGWEVDLTLTLATSTAYTLSASTVSFTAGSTTASPASVTLTAVNNQVDAADIAVNLATTSSISDTRVILSSATPTLTITDDDELAAPANFAAAKGTDFTSLVLSWDPVTGADNYKVAYKESTSSTWSADTTVATSNCTGTPTKCSYTISSLTSATLYDVRVYAEKTDANVDDGPASTAQQSPGKDYDADDDGLIEVSSLAQLNAIRWDLDANGSSTDSGYATAFPTPTAGMGCPSAGCTGYELRANLDFNTNNSAKTAANPTGADSGDTYWNSGAGWTPIGGATAYTGAFDGNNDTDSSGDGGPYKISNLFINATTGQYFGLFGRTRSGTPHLNTSLWRTSQSLARAPPARTSTSAVWRAGLTGK